MGNADSIIGYDTNLSWQGNGIGFIIAKLEQLDFQWGDGDQFYVLTTNYNTYNSYIYSDDNPSDAEFYIVNGDQTVFTSDSFENTTTVGNNNVNETYDGANYWIKYNIGESQEYMLSENAFDTVAYYADVRSMINIVSSEGLNDVLTNSPNTNLGMYLGKSTGLNPYFSISIQLTPLDSSGSIGVYDTSGLNGNYVTPHYWNIYGVTSQSYFYDSALVINGAVIYAQPSSTSTDTIQAGLSGQFALLWQIADSSSALRSIIATSNESVYSYDLYSQNSSSSGSNLIGDYNVGSSNSDSTFMVCVSVTINSISTNSLTIVAEWKDENGNLQYYTSPAITTTGHLSITPQTMKINSASDLLIVVEYSAVGGAINFNSTVRVVKQ